MTWAKMVFIPFSLLLASFIPTSVQETTREKSSLYHDDTAAIERKSQAIIERSLGEQLLLQDHHLKRRGLSYPATASRSKSVDFRNMSNNVYSSLEWAGLINLSVKGKRSKSMRDGTSIKRKIRHSRNRKRKIWQLEELEIGDILTERYHHNVEQGRNRREVGNVNNNNNEIINQDNQTDIGEDAHDKEADDNDAEDDKSVGSLNHIPGLSSSDEKFLEYGMYGQEEDDDLPSTSTLDELVEDSFDDDYDDEGLSDSMERQRHQFQR